MKDITTNELSTVTGGKTSDAVTQQLTALQGSIKDLASAQSTKSGSDPTTMLMMMLALRPQQQAATVVAAPAAGSAPIVPRRSRVCCSDRPVLARAVETW